MKPAHELAGELARYERILVAVDSSPDSETATAEVVRVAALLGAEVTGLHAYAARLHDQRFRQMEGVLPPQFQQEDELDRQRGVHDKLITRGLGLISDSYLDQTERACEEAGVPFRRLGAEGKNYRVILDQAAGAEHDLLVLGFQGLGAVRSSVPGSVCVRVARQTSIDTLIVKSGARPLGSGPIVVGVDGSERSFGAVVTASALARCLEVPVHLVAVYDPHFHTVAFDRIGEVISEAAGKVFKLKEQEKLHGEIIDSGLAQIYQTHLDVAHEVARSAGSEPQSVLLAGKPYDALLRYLDEVEASLVVVGKLGIHADDGLDIGGNTEQLLCLSSTHMLIGCREHTPDVELVAEQTLSWTEEAETRLERVPASFRNMVRKAIGAWALERGHAVVTVSVVEQAKSELLPR